MPENPNPQQVIDQPKAENKPAKGQSEIFVMPDKYRGGAQKMMAPAPLQAPAPPPKPAPPPPPPPPAKKKAPPLKKKKSKKGLVVFGVIFLLVLSAGGYYALKTLQPAEEPGPVVTPAPVTPTPKPPATTEPETQPEPEPGEPGSPFPQASRPGTDSDSDGLTDIEERLVYQTNERLPDTDSDGFLDGNEVFHRYNPVALAPGTLLETGLVKVFTSASEDYGIFYPSVWDAETDPANPGQVLIQVTTGETITISVQAKDAAQDLRSWYEQNVEANGVFSTTTKNNLPALVSDNQLSYYIDGGERVIHLKYDTGAKGTIDYLQTFQMMINSLELP